MVNSRTKRLTLTASDVSGQRIAKLRGVQRDSTVGELIDNLLPKMDIPRFDVNGRPLTYRARLDREGRHLHNSEVVEEVLRENDHIVLHPNVDAGQRA